MNKEFEGKVALVTGGSRGMGRAIALQLARGGAHVAIGYGTRKETAENVVKELQDLGSQALCAPCDLRSQQQVDEFVGKTRDELGPIELLVNSGAISDFTDHTEMTWEIWSDTINVNLHGVYRILFAVKDEMIERKFGRVVLISSIASYNFRPQQLHYATSKSAVITMTAWCAEVFGPHNLRVNCIAPGLVDTEMAQVLPADLMEKAIQATPLRRIGKPEEIAELTCFLLGERSSFMTGQTVISSGGRAIRH